MLEAPVRRLTEKRRQAVNLCRDRKSHYEDSGMNKVELLSGSGHQDVLPAGKKATERICPSSTFSEYASGNVLINNDEVLATWREYFAELLGQYTSETPAE